MILTLRHPGAENLVFDYRPDTGEILGRDAHLVLIMMEQADGKAKLPGQWGAIDIPDPRTNPRDMAILLASNGYILPPDLAALVPEQVDTTTPADAVN